MEAESTKTRSRAAYVRQALARIVEEMKGDVDIPLPSERALSEELGVARMTLRKGIEELVEEGKLIKVVGKGTFLAPEKTALHMGLRGYSEEMRQRGLEPASELLAFDQVPAPAAMAKEMRLHPGAPLMRMKRLLLADGAPMSVDENFIPLKLVPGILQGEAPSSLYGHLQERYGIQMDWGEDLISATAATATLSRQLKVELGFPLLRQQRRAYINADLINYSVSYYRADRYSLRVPLRRSSKRRYVPKVRREES